MKRTFDFGRIDFEDRGRASNRVTIDMEYKTEGDKKCFSVCGNVWNTRNSDIVCGGQCLDIIAPYINDPVFSEILRLWDLYHLNNMHPECIHQHADGWHKKASEKVTLYHWRMTPEAIDEQKAVEKAALLALRCGETFKPTPKEQFLANLSYSLITHTETVPENIAKFYEPKKPLFPGDKGHTEVETLGWLDQSEHPDGLLSRPCPVCGYRYGSSWVYFPIPTDDERVIYTLLETGAL